MLLTVHLWRALKAPPVLHPLFQRLLDERGRAAWEQMRAALWTVTAVLTLVMLMAMPVIFFLVIIGGPIIYAILTTLFFGSLWIIDIAGTLSRELNQKTYDLECLMPIGTLGTNWIISTGRLHWKDGLERSMGEIFAVTQLFLLSTMFVMIGIVVTPHGEERVQLIYLLSIIVSLIVFLYLDHIQSTITGVCIALIAARQTRTVGDARLWSLLCFLALQFGWYIGMLLFAVGVLPWLIAVLQLTHPIFGVFMPPLTVGLSFSLRELLIRLLWSRALLRMNADSYDLKLLERYV
jgi:hypothetical protein